MSNFARAIKALNDVDEAIDHLADNEAYVTALKTAGLLMPDLPEPGNNHSPSWGVVHLDKKKQVIKIGINGVMARTPETAREWAYGLLAAADYAEKEQNNE